MNLTAIVHSTGWTVVVTDFGPSSFKTPHGVMKLDTFLAKLRETEAKRVCVRPPRSAEEWEWEVSHSGGIVTE